jgi:hypothetical protein
MNAESSSHELPDYDREVDKPEVNKADSEIESHTEHNNARNYLMSLGEDLRAEDITEKENGVVVMGMIEMMARDFDHLQLTDPQMTLIGNFIKDLRDRVFISPQRELDRKKIFRRLGREARGEVVLDSESLQRRADIDRDLMHLYTFLKGIEGRQP